MNSKYSPLEALLRDSGRPRLPMTFRQIERVIGSRLPPAARRHRTMWSNNPGNWVMTKAWLKAGYKTEKVDMKRQRLVFRKAVRSVPVPGPGGEASLAQRTGSFVDALGSLKDTVTILAGTDLSDPIDEEWNVAR
ncbi:MAG: hypothetical protein OXJ37_13355 [Bryobacterales bacterium]|nr:hypothetical protein [Bryobacterales bacterium]